MRGPVTGAAARATPAATSSGRRDRERRRGRAFGTRGLGGPAASAETVLRLAVLLQAGIAPARAWGYLADSGDPVAAGIVRRLRDGAPIADAVAAVAETTAAAAPGDAAAAGAHATHADAEAWRDIAAAYRVATTVGAPLAESLRGLAAALRDAQAAADDVQVALAEPAGTARLIGWLPFVALGLGLLLGFDTLGVLVAQPLGITCLIVGVVLIVISQRWTARLVRRAAAAGGVPGLGADLLAIALSGGVSAERACSVVRDARGGAVDAESAAVLALSRTAGVPAVELLRASAAHARHRARVEGRLRAARLSSRLLIPLGVCTLPAFLLLGVGPMLLSVMTAVPLTP